MPDDPVATLVDGTAAKQKLRLSQCPPHSEAELRLLKVAIGAAMREQEHDRSLDALEHAWVDLPDVLCELCATLHAERHHWLLADPLVHRSIVGRLRHLHKKKKCFMFICVFASFFFAAGGASLALLPLLASTML